MLRNVVRGWDLMSDV